MEKQFHSTPGRSSAVMPFPTQCPECNTKLKLAQSPDPGEQIECPKCGGVFVPLPDGPAEEPAAEEPAVAVKKKKKSKGGTKVKGGPKKRKAIKKKTNPYFLVILLGGAFFLLAGIGVLFYVLAGRAGKIQEIVMCVPSDFNHLRGMNIGQISKYPGYAGEIDKQLPPGAKGGFDDLSKATGLSDYELKDYFLTARSRKNGTTTVMYILRTKKDVDSGKLATGVGNQDTVDGQVVARVPNKVDNFLSNSTVFSPTKRVIVVVPNGTRAAEVVKASIANKGAKPQDTLYGKLGRAGQIATRGDLWLVVRSLDDLKHYAGATGDPFKEAFKTLSDEMAKTSTFSMWTNFGGSGIKMGMAMQCADADRAKAVAKSMDDGPLGKKDDAEIPNAMKSAYSQSTSKEFREFLSNIVFTNDADAAVMTSKMTGDKATRFADQINKAENGVTWDPRNDDYAKKQK